jgi:hypothetical protein
MKSPDNVNRDRMTYAFITAILHGFTIFNTEGSILLIVMPQNPFADLAAPEGLVQPHVFL